ncbi:DUF4132 domain-containing protein [Gallaecimonas xiamenensis]|uniref:PBS lyase HEAT domain protein repeat-containing protein n=1 Tax=Gallaecimonas xiamenensis 3-C-1 TaxID=745411 RepID=K2JW52_9GAMM|nr:DUF4132 domain-containing protein [Gallaecimonas xiamenensis]EKE69460.1 PBS lyase HEAT domain protein repeat-containing protein [Gallaecimonas xiamenensis 3-C-1]
MSYPHPANLVAMDEAAARPLLKTAMAGFHHFRDHNLQDDSVPADPALAEALADFIATGQPTQAEIERRFAQLRQRIKDMPGPGVFAHYAWPDSGFEWQVKSAMIRVASSSFFYQPEVLARVAQVQLLCSDNNATCKDPWINGLLTLYLRLYAGQSDRCLPMEMIPSGDQLLAIARAHSQPQAMVYQWLLGAHGLQEHKAETIDWWAAIAQDQATDWLKALSVNTKGQLCEYLLRPVRQATQAHYPALLQLAADGNDKIRRLAKGLLHQTHGDAQAAAPLLDYLAQHYPQAKHNVRRHWAALTGTLPGAQHCLKSWLASESNAAAKTVLQDALALLAEVAPAQQDQHSWDIPPMPPLPECVIPQDWHPILQGTLERTRAQRQQELDESQDKRERKRLRESLAALAEINEPRLAEMLANLAAGEQDGFHGPFFHAFEQAGLWYHPQTPLQVTIALPYGDGRYWYQHLDKPVMCAASRRELTDLRQFIAILDKITDGDGSASLPWFMMSQQWYPARTLPQAVAHLRLWPFFAENPQYIEQGLNNKVYKIDNSVYGNAILEQTLLIMGDFPSLPHPWAQALYQHAIGTGKTLRQLARDSAERIGIQPDYIFPGLRAKEAQLRQNAADWLGELKCTKAQAPLQEAIAKEKDPLVRAVMMVALARCGGDVSALLTPQALAGEAKAGLKKALPKSMAWFTPELLPSCRFIDGSAVDPAILHWWAVLAVKLNQPEGKDIFAPYLGQLDQPSRQALGTAVLTAFVDQDLRCPSDDEAHDYAESYKHQRLSSYQRWGAQYQHKTLEDAYLDCFKEHKAELLGSALKDKGLLALTGEVAVQTALEPLDRYLRKHHQRRAQIEALLLAIGHRQEPAVAQLLLALARRYRSAGIQQLARQLVDQLAQRNGWTAEQLADRTIQTAGLEQATGASPFAYGSRTLALSLGDNLKLRLEDENGKELKALPQPRNEDDSDDIKEIRSWFSNCKKELKAVLEQQQARLSEAMITDRRWPVADWLQDLHQHPVMYRLLQRSLWQVELDGQWQSFRPTEDGAFINLDDDELDLAKGQGIRLLSANQLDAKALKAWRKHLKDYKVKPLFEQLLSASLDLTQQQRRLNHHRGRLSQSSKLRSMLTKLGYRPGNADAGGGYFDTYVKRFPSLGMAVEFGFTGAYISESDEPVALDGLSISQGGTRVDLNWAPANLLNAVALDYETVASQCELDPQWESKIL